MFDYYVKIADQCGHFLAKCRTEANFSRKKMSHEIGVSESTIKAWEMGQGSPTLPMLLKWFRVTGCNPYKYLLDFFWPEYFEGLTFESPDEKIRRAVQFYISDVAHQSVIEKLHYLVFNDFGGEWTGVLNMICAHASTSLNSRCRTAEIIMTSYEFSVANHTARILPGIEPNCNLLLQAISEAKNATMINKRGYAIGADDGSWSKLSSSILSRSRIDSGKTQLYMAKAMGKSERTIQNWESTGEPTFLEICHWLYVLKKEFWPYMCSAIYPSEPMGTSERDQHLRMDLQDYLTNADIEDVRKLCHLITGGYGSSWDAVLEMLVEHVCTPLYQRVMTARTILISYELDSNDSAFNRQDHTLPDIGYLKRCIDSATEAAKEGKNSYCV